MYDPANLTLDSNDIKLGHENPKSSLKSKTNNYTKDNLQTPIYKGMNEDLPDAGLDYSSHDLKLNVYNDYGPNQSP